MNNREMVKIGMHKQCIHLSAVNAVQCGNVWYGTVQCGDGNSRLTRVVIDTGR